MRDNEKSNVVDLLIHDLKWLGDIIPKNISQGSRDIRVFQEKWQENLQEESSNSWDPGLKFLIFFLCNLIDDIYYNLIGDFPSYKKFEAQIKEIRYSIFYSVGDTFLEISGCLEGFDQPYPHCYECCIKIVDIYLKKIQQLNLLLTPKDILLI